LNELHLTAQQTDEVQKRTRHLLSDTAFAFRTEPVQMQQNPSCREKSKWKVSLEGMKEILQSMHADVVWGI